MQPLHFTLTGWLKALLPIVARPWNQQILCMIFRAFPGLREG